CAFGEMEEEHLRSGQHFSCDGSGASAQPTMSTPALCGLAASMGATIALRHLLGLGEPLGDSLFEWCGFTSESWSGPIRRRDDCPTDHQRWTVLRLDRPLGEITPRQVAAACGLEWSSALRFEMDDFVFADPAMRESSPRFLVERGSIPDVFSRRQICAAILQP